MLDYVWSGNHKQSVARTYRQHKAWMARRARAKLSILDTVHKPLHSLKRVILK